MTDLRITKRGLIEGAPRFRGVVGVMRSGSFSGAVEAGFSAWVGRRWGLMGERNITPVRKSFRMQKSHPGPVLCPLALLIAPASYASFSTLNLTVDFRRVASAFLTKAAPDPVFDHPILPTIRQELDRQRPVANRFLREPRASFSLLRRRILEIRGWTSREKSLSVLFNREGFPVAGSPGRRPVDRIKIPMLRGALQRPALIRVPGANLRWTHFFKEHFIGSALRLNKSGDAITARAEMFVSLRSIKGESQRAWRTSLLRNAADTARGDAPVATWQWSSLLLTALGSKSEQAAVRRFFTTLRLAFLAPKQADAHAATQRTSRFGSSPPLYYAGRDALPVRAMADALRTFRQSLSEIKAPAPAPAPQIDQLTRQVYDQLKRELRIEKERRGL